MTENEKKSIAYANQIKKTARLEKRLEEAQYELDRMPQRYVIKRQEMQDLIDSLTEKICDSKKKERESVMLIATTSKGINMAKLIGIVTYVAAKIIDSTAEVAVVCGEKNIRKNLGEKKPNNRICGK